MGKEKTEEVAFWNMHIPRSEWTAQCPDYLEDVYESDRRHLQVRDEDYRLLDWKDVCKIVGENQLQLFTRIPSELRRYRKYMAQIKKDYGSVMNFILQERVRWKDSTPKGEPFENADQSAQVYLLDDIRILLNDWPYGIDPKIVHLVVWTKFQFEQDPKTGDLTTEARKQIDNYVTKTFRKGPEDPNVIWFKNWSSLMSIHAVVHFHVMMCDPSPDFVQMITKDDEALSTRLSRDSSQ